MTFFLVAIAVKDFYTQRIPVWWLWLLAPVVFCYQGFVGQISIGRMLFGALIAGGFFLGLFFLSKTRWFGSGDVWFAGFIGLVLGWPHILTSLYLTCLLSGCLVIVFWRKFKKEQTIRLPFAPILAASTIATLWFGSVFEQWVQRWIG